MKNLMLSVVALVAFVAIGASNAEACHRVKVKCCEPVCCEPVVVKCCEPVCCCKPAKVRKAKVRKSRCCVAAICCPTTPYTYVVQPVILPAPSIN